MPPIIAVIATLVTAYGYVTAITIVIMAASIAYSAYAMATMPDMPGYSAEIRGRTQVVRSAVTPHKIIYGLVMVSGPLVAAFNMGTNNYWIYLVIVLAAHEVEEIGDVYLGDKLSTDPQFTISDPIPEVGHWVVTGGTSTWVVDTPADPTHTIQLVEITKYLGTPGQAAAPELIYNAKDTSGDYCWTADHTLSGRAYIVVKLKYDTTAFPQGIPNIKAVVKGVNNIYDPRTGLSGYTTNWALCMRDYLTKSYGLGCSSDEINDDYFIAAANVCDEAMSLSGGGTEPRYTCNGVFSLDQKPIDTIKKLLTAAVGQLDWCQGKYRIFPAAFSTPVSRVLTVSDLRDNLSIIPAPSRTSKINTVRGTFVDPQQFWQQVDFPIVQHAAAYAIDGQELVDNIELPYTTSGITAQRLATVHLNRSLLAITVSWPGKLTCFGYQPQDVVPVTVEQLGWDEKLFRVTGWSLTENGGVDLVLREEDPAVYGWTADQAVAHVFPPTPQINWPPVLTLAAPTGPVATGGALHIALAWTAVAGATSYNIYYSTTAGVTKYNGTKLSTPVAHKDITGLTAATTYYFVVAAFNGFWESTESVQVSAATT